MNKVQQQLNRLYKKHFGKMVAAMLYFSPDIDWETAEDIVQDAFSAALTTWQEDAIPANPAGWLYTVCKNKALNKIKVDKKFTPLSAEYPSDSTEVPITESCWDDPILKLLFACAHPDLGPKVQVVITLKYVANLKAEAIARIFGMTIDGVDKLLARARQKIRNEKILLKEPGLPALHPRLPIVHKIIYLLFNEGYKSSWGKEIIRRELCEEALLLNKTLLDSTIATKETAALHALMLFNAARFRARFGKNGELLDLENQDRALWDQRLIALGAQFLKQSQGIVISSYHYEASIAWLHCTAKSFAVTNWENIAGLYLQLLQSYPNPFVELNYAIALYYAGEKQQSLAILDELQQKPLLSQYYLLNAALGKIHFLEGNYKKAKEFFIKTLHQTTFRLEKDFIQKMIDKIDA